VFVLTSNDDITDFDRDFGPLFTTLLVGNYKLGEEREGGGGWGATGLFDGVAEIHPAKILVGDLQELLCSGSKIFILNLSTSLVLMKQTG
jgi:hypothetical protein